MIGMRWIAVLASLCAACHQPAVAPSPPNPPPGPSAADVAMLPTRGAMGVAGFGYITGFGSFTGFDQPLAANADQAGGALVLGTAPKVASVASSDPTVVTFSVSTLPTPAWIVANLTAHAAGVGTAQMQLLDANGGLIDFAVITVEQPNVVTIAGPDGLALIAGDQNFYRATSFHDGTPLLGTGGLTLSYDGPVGPGDWSQLHVDDGNTLMEHDDYVFVGSASGPAAIHFKSAAIEVTRTLTLFYYSDVTKVVPSAPSTSGSGCPPTIGIKPYVGARPVYGAFCNWSTSPPGVVGNLGFTCNSGGGSWEIGGAGGWTGDAPGSLYSFVGPAGHYVATCTIGSQSANVDVTIN